MSGISAVLGLFVASFVAATLLPAQSEAVLSALILLDQHSVVLLVAVASFGNIAGSIINWLLGRGVEQFRTQRWFPVSSGMLDRATVWYQRFGRWSLLLSWLPIIGDPITVVAGVLREPLVSFTILVTIAKTSRYIFLAFVIVNWAPA
ncbi:MAG: hypothetical protein COA52_14700 [Hyphomicrobiales bacterium]|nr:DedA family protein [Hyphomicrobiales bacterium]PCJ86833.1 MAG: hypothetical protein COA52_14700 [Hyphomicrobiales bacterium]